MKLIALWLVWLASAASIVALIWVLRAKALLLLLAYALWLAWEIRRAGVENNGTKERTRFTQMELHQDVTG